MREREGERERKRKTERERQTDRRTEREEGNRERKKREREREKNYRSLLLSDDPLCCNFMQSMKRHRAKLCGILNTALFISDHKVKTQLPKIEEKIK